VFAHVLLSWFRVDPRNPIVKFIEKTVEPILNKIKSKLPELAEILRELRSILDEFQVTGKDYSKQIHNSQASELLESVINKEKGVDILKEPIIVKA
jgi:hypothetical protein